MKSTAFLAVLMLATGSFGMQIHGENESQNVAMKDQPMTGFERASSRNKEVRRVEYGVCRSLRVTEANATSDTRRAERNSLSPKMYAIDLLSARKRRELNAVGGSASVDWDWYNAWMKSLKVKVLRAPAYGSFEDAKQNLNLPVTPNVGYLGKDRVDVLVEGTDDLKRPFALTLRYHLTVLSQAEERRIYKGRESPFKELCGKNHNRWTISQEEALDNNYRLAVETDQKSLPRYF